MADTRTSTVIESHVFAKETLEIRQTPKGARTHHVIRDGKAQRITNGVYNNLLLGARASASGSYASPFASSAR